jgi:hypothetical protein
MFCQLEKYFLFDNLSEVFARAALLIPLSALKKVKFRQSYISLSENPAKSKSRTLKISSDSKSRTLKISGENFEFDETMNKFPFYKVQ